MLIAFKTSLIAACVFCFSVGSHGQNVPPHRRITESVALDTVWSLPEVNKEDAYVRRVTKGKRHLLSMVYEKPDNQHPYYWIKVAEDNGVSYYSHFNFYVNVKTGKILFLDTDHDTAIDLNTWRKLKQIAERTPYREIRSIKLVDSSTGHYFILDSAHIIVTAFDANQKILWKTEPWKDNNLKRYLRPDPTVNSALIDYFVLGPKNEKSWCEVPGDTRALWIGFDTNQFGYLDIRNGKFKFCGQD